MRIKEKMCLNIFAFGKFTYEPAAKGGFPRAHITYDDI